MGHQILTWLVRIARAIGLILALAVIAAVLVGGAEMLVRNEPVVSTPPLSGDYVTVQPDERVFTIMAALNATGYDDENNEQGMHPVRRKVRAQLAQRSIPSAARLRLYFQAHASQYVTWTLTRTNPPELKRQAPGWDLDVPAFLFFGLDEALRDFAREADTASLWRENQPAYQAEAEQYRSLAGPAVQKLLAYLRVKPRAGDHVVVIPNLLDAYWRGYGPSVDHVSYVVVGPSPAPNIGEVQHEAMHPIVNPLVAANLKVIDKAQADRLTALLVPRVGSGYSQWETIVDESVIRAIGVRLDAPANREANIRRNEQQGFVLIRPLLAGLEAYEQTNVSIADYMPQLLERLNQVEVDRLPAP